MKKLSDVVDNELAKNTKFNKLKRKLNSLQKKIPDATALIRINQYNTDKCFFDKKKNRLQIYWLQLFLIQNLVKLKTKFLFMIPIIKISHY